MKRLLLLSVMVAFQCTDKKQENLETPTSNPASFDSISVEKPADSVNPKMADWLAYYQSQSPDFTMEKFEPASATEINFEETSTKARYDVGYNTIYDPFLVFSPDGTKYIDFDSYNWLVSSDGNLGFEADQEVILVNVQQKTKNRIAFFGPSYRIEAAYWSDNNQAILLGNSDDRVPFKIELDLKEKKSKYFQYPDTLNFKSDYRNLRIEKRSLKIN